MTAAQLRERRARILVSTDRPPFLLELVAVTVVYLLFSNVQGDLGQDAASATRNAHTIQSLERHLHIAVEAAANQWAAGVGWLAQWSAVFYALVLVAPPLVLVVLYIVRPDVYAGHRRSLVALSFLSLPVFWLFPVSPPRLAQPGIIDVVALNSLLGAKTSPASADHANLYAATPSLHVAWSMWCGHALTHVVPAGRKVLRLLPWLLPLAVAVDVVITGNHYVVDVVLGIALALLAGYLDTLQVRRSHRLLRSAGHDADRPVEGSAEPLLGAG